MWFATNPNAHWNYYQMTQSWMEFLRSQGHELEEHRYSSYNDDPATNDEYLFDILREMLIFHSNNFGK
jgi:predicted deacetylase